MCQKKGAALLTVWIFSTLLVFLMTEQAGAFCVYNNSDRQMHVMQSYGFKIGRGFDKFISSGDHACCNWKDKDCNKKGKRDSTVKFNVDYARFVFYFTPCADFPIKAGGWLSISGDIHKGYHRKRTILARNHPKNHLKRNDTRRSAIPGYAGGVTRRLIPDPGYRLRRSMLYENRNEAPIEEKSRF
jgi:hypothetical protein